MRIINFNGGPAAMPPSVLEEAARDMLDWRGTGMSVMENSHREKEVTAMVEEAEADLRSLLGLGEEWAVIFCQGGASLQFTMLSMNFAGPAGRCDYVNTGTWSARAYEEARLSGADPRWAATSEPDNFTYIPETFDFDPEAKYVHITSNNTIHGTQWQTYPKTKSPLISDMSSEFLSRPVDLDKFSLIYAGAQKNVGPAGVAVAALRRELAGRACKDLPSLLSYPVYIKNESMYNTPPVWAIYVSGLIFKWLKNTVGGLEAVSRLNQAKAETLYHVLDKSGGFYRGTARPDSRSLMNVTFLLPSEELTDRFKKEARAEGLEGLGGHRSVGGLRVSLYNAVTMADVNKLIEFMREFQRVRG
jgi:phosphoserine aminotransferase